MIFLAAYLGCLIYFYVKADVALYYLIWGVVLAVFMFVKSKRSSDTHIHHYVVAMIVLSFTCYQQIFITIVQGVFNGIMIEGASRWGYDPIWTSQ